MTLDMTLGHISGESAVLTFISYGFGERTPHKNELEAIVLTTLVEKSNCLEVHSNWGYQNGTCLNLMRL
jgi:hypothetical protein